MILEDQILTKVRGWLLEITDLSADQVVPADDEGVRPALPYITIRVLTDDIQTATPQVKHIDVDGDLIEEIRTQFEGSIQLDAYGRSGRDYLARAGRLLWSTQSQNYLRDALISLRLVGGINDLSTLVDDAIEGRHQRDLFFGYALIDRPDEHPVEAETVDGSFDFSGHEFDASVDLSLGGLQTTLQGALG